MRPRRDRRLGGLTAEIRPSELSAAERQLIAHRVRSALRAERVLVLDGSDATVGSHHSLLRRSALYADLVNHWGGSDDELTRPVDDQIQPASRALRIASMRLLVLVLERIRDR